MEDCGKATSRTALDDELFGSRQAARQHSVDHSAGHLDYVTTLHITNSADVRIEHCYTTKVYALPVAQVARGETVHEKGRTLERNCRKPYPCTMMGAGL